MWMMNYASTPRAWVYASRLSPSSSPSSASSAPPARLGAAMVWSYNWKTLLMYGGFKNATATTVKFPEIWQLYAGQWSLLWSSNSTIASYSGSGMQPAILNDCAIWYGEEIIVYGGRSSEPSEMWVFTDGTWSLRLVAVREPVFPPTGQSSCPGCQPGSRYSMITWVTGSNYFLWGGLTINSINGAERALNDLWSYNTTTGWTYYASNQNAPTTGKSNATLLTTYTVDPPQARTAGNSLGSWLYGGLGAFGEDYSNQVAYRDYTSSYFSVITFSASIPPPPKYPSITSPSFSRSGMVTVNGQIFVGYGYYGSEKALAQEFYSYNRTLKTWSRLNVAAGPAPHLDPILFSDGVYVYDLITDYGDTNSSLDLWKFRIDTKVWSQVFSVESNFGGNNTFPPARKSVYTHFDGAKLWFLGGRRDYITYGELWNLNIADMTWTVADYTPTIPVPRSLGTMCGDNVSKLYTFGGDDYGGHYLWSYDIPTNVWTMLSSLNYSITYPPLGGTSPQASPGWRKKSGLFVYEQNVYVFGGLYFDAPEFYQGNDLWMFKADTSEWYWLAGTKDKPAPSYPAFIASTTALNYPAGRATASFAFDGNSLFFHGGAGNPDPKHPTIENNMGDLWSITPGQIKTTRMVAAYEWKEGSPRPYPPVPSRSTSSPGLRQDHAFCTDGNGNLWLYGGTISVSTKNVAVAADLWWYNSSSKAWEWVTGYISTPLDYTVRPHPGPRIQATMFASGNNYLYLFGGSGADNARRNDMWRYDKAANAWTFVSGSQTPNAGPDRYGPGSLSAYARFVRNEELWIYGGVINSILYADIWQFKPSSESWTLVSSAVPGAPRNNTFPGGRSRAAMWVLPDLTVRIFGGYANLSQFFAANDLWEYTSTDYKWKFISGTDTYNQPDYITQNTPGSRALVKATYLIGTDMYLYSGSARTDANRENDDLWTYRNNQWIYIGRSQIPITDSTTMMFAYDSSWTNFPNGTVLFYGRAFVATDNIITGTRNLTGNYFNTLSTSLYYPPVYPSQRLSSTVTNYPGAIFYSAMQYMPNSGALYLLGGNTVTNDLKESNVSGFWQQTLANRSWTYEPSARGMEVLGKANLATWANKNQLFLFGGNDGIQFSNALYVGNLGSFSLLGGGKELVSNASWPGSRSNCYFTSQGDDLYLFGGTGYTTTTTPGLLQEIWKFNVVDLKWTLINGSQTPYTTTVPGYPGGRRSGVMTGNATHLFIFGGLERDKALRLVSTSELWQLELATMKWTMLSNLQKNYPPVVGMGGKIYGPGPRDSLAATMLNGSIFIFGGKDSIQMAYNDVWEFKIEERIWYWIGGQGYSQLPFLGGLEQKDNSTLLPAGRYQMSFTPYESGMMVYGGVGSNPQTQATDFVRSYYPVTALADSWYIRIVEKPAVLPSTSSSSTGIVLTTSSVSSTTTAKSTTSTSTTGSTGPKCGNGIVESGEDCDSTRRCCDLTTCKFARQGVVCNSTVVGVCDAADVCSGNSDECHNTSQSPGFICRRSTGPCMVPMACGNSTKDCPPDVVLALDSCGVCGGDGTSCTINGTCGDGRCNPDISESCSSCVLDCQYLCPSLSCKDDCNNRGKCDNGKCVCNEKWSGPTCSIENAQIVTETNGTDVKITVNTTVSFSLKITEVAEITPASQIITRIPIQTQNISVTTSSVGGIERWNHTITLNNSAHLEFQFVKTGSTSTSVKYGNQTFVIQPNTIKVTIEIVNWPFTSIKNQLRFLLDVANSGGCDVVNSQVDDSGNIRWLELYENQYSLYGSFLDYALVDDIERPMVVSSVNNGTSVALIIPHFWVKTVIDPNFSVLFDASKPSTVDSCGNLVSSKKRSSTQKAAIIAGIVAGVAVVALVSVGGFILWRRKRVAHKRLRSATNTQK